MSKGPFVITKVKTAGGPCGDVDLDLTQISQDKARIVCPKCGAKKNVVLFGGLVDRDGFERLENAVAELHDKAEPTGGAGHA